MRTIVAPFLEVKFDQGAVGRFRGYGSIFGNVDLGNDICVKGCFVDSITEHKSNNTMPLMCWMHKMEEPIGDWLDMGEDVKGLFVEGQLWLGDNETECSRKANNLLRGTGPKGLSIGYKTVKAGRDTKSGARTLEALKVREISVVGYAMNPLANVTSIKSLIEDGGIPTVRELEELLRDAGLSANQAKAILADGYKAIQRDAGAEEAKAQEEIREVARLLAILRGEVEHC